MSVSSDSSISHFLPESIGCVTAGHYCVLVSVVVNTLDDCSAEGHASKQYFFAVYFFTLLVLASLVGSSCAMCNCFMAMCKC